jgi:ubiquinone/menaquinone biosynthesis C-methylase UbiE
VSNEDSALRDSEHPRPSPEGFDHVFANLSAGRVVHELFDRFMGPFPPHVEPFSLVTREGLERVLVDLRLEPDHHLVDLCCGRGGIGLWFAQGSGARLTGVDFSPAAIAEARRRAELFFADTRASFVVADAGEIPLDGESADAVVCIDALQMLPDREAALREAGRLVRGDGRIVITTLEFDESVFGRAPLADVGQLVKAAGLRLLVREEHPEWVERQTRLYENAIAADSDNAEPAVRSLAEEGRNVLPLIAQTRRVLVVADRIGGGQLSASSP